MKWFWAALIVIVAETPAWAHNLGAECRLKDGKVEVEAYFDDDTPAADAAVRITNGDKKVIATGRTNKDGKWSFAVPEAGRYELIVDAGDGHRVTRPFDITIDSRLAQAPAREPKDVPPSPRPPQQTGEPGVSSGTILTSEGPTRQEFTSFPWLKLCIGLGAILAFSAAFLIARRAR